MNAFSPEFDGLDELLSAYLDGELSPADRARVDLLLAEREEYRAALAELRSLRENMLGLPPVKASPNFYARVLAAIGEAQIEDLAPVSMPAASKPAVSIPTVSAPAAATPAPSKPAAVAAPPAPVVAPKSEWNTPIWPILAAGALAASVAFALLAPSWSGKDGDVIGVLPSEPAPKQVAKPAEPPIRGPQTAKPPVANGGEANPHATNPKPNRSGENGRKPSPEVAKADASPKKKAEENKAGESDAELQRKRLEKAAATPEQLARGNANPGPKVASPGIEGIGKGEAQNQATKPAPGARRGLDKNGAERVMVAELRLSRSGPTKEALRDFFAWQGIAWQDGAAKIDDRSDARATAASAGGQPEAKKEASFAAAPAPPDVQLGRPVEQQVENADGTVEVVYVETTPKQWREMTAVLQEWQGARLTFLAANSKAESREPRKALDEAREDNGGGRSLELRNREIAETQKAGLAGARPAAGLEDAKAALADRAKPPVAGAAPAPAPPAAPPAPKREAANAAKPGDAQIAARQADSLPAAGERKLKGMIEQEDRFGAAKDKETDRAGIAIPYSPFAAKQVVDKLLAAHRNADKQGRGGPGADRDGKNRADSNGVRSEEIPVPQQAEKLRARDEGERVRIVLMIRPDDAAPSDAAPSDAAPSDAAPASPK